ncbi:unnamed protein product [Symbiodinium sp. CCMP2592]|nr:unnamed protein product [Symbiodinium sp. CCMP2592]
MARYHCALLLLVAANAFEVCPYAVDYAVRTGQITHLPDCASACPGMCRLVDQAVRIPRDEDQMERLDELQCQHHQVFTCAWRESKCESFMFQLEFCPRHLPQPISGAGVGYPNWSYALGREEPGPIMTLLLALLDLVLRLFSPPKSEIIQVHVHDVQQANILIM